MNDKSVTQIKVPAALARRLGRWLCSVRLALMLILLITVVSLTGALIIQASSEVLGNPLSQDRWIEGLRPRFGPFTGLFDFLGLFRVFRMWWFNALAVLLVLNLATCTINRFPATWRTLRQPRVKVGQGFLERRRYQARFPSLALSRPEASEVVVKALRQRRYQVTTINEDDNSHIYAERNRYSRFGTFFTHSGIILAIAAALVGNMFGFSDNVTCSPKSSPHGVRVLWDNQT